MSLPVYNVMDLPHSLCSSHPTQTLAESLAVFSLGSSTSLRPIQLRVRRATSHARATNSLRLSRTQNPSSLSLSSFTLSIFRSCLLARILALRPPLAPRCPSSLPASSTHRTTRAPLRSACVTRDIQKVCARPLTLDFDVLPPSMFPRSPRASSAPERICKPPGSVLMRPSAASTDRLACGSIKATSTDYGSVSGDTRRGNVVAELPREQTVQGCNCRLVSASAFAAP